MEQNTNRVNLRAEGALGPLAWTQGCLIAMGRDEGYVWAAATIKELYLEMAMALLVLQGRPLQEFFQADAFLQDVGPGRKPVRLLTGPFIYLRGAMSDRWDPRPRLKNVVLIKLHEKPEAVTSEETLSFLLNRYA